MMGGSDWPERGPKAHRPPHHGGTLQQTELHPPTSCSINGPWRNRSALSQPCGLPCGDADGWAISARNGLLVALLDDMDVATGEEPVAEVADRALDASLVCGVEAEPERSPRSGIANELRL